MLCLAAMLVVQAMLFVWVASRTGSASAGQPPERFAADGRLQICRRPRARSSARPRASYCATSTGATRIRSSCCSADGSVMTNGGGWPNGRRPAPHPGDVAARRLPAGRERFRPGPRLRTRRPRADGPPPGEGRARPTAALDAASASGRARALWRTSGPGGPGRSIPACADPPRPIVVNGTVTGVVVVPPRRRSASCWRATRRRWRPSPPAALVVGALLATLIVFGPARRRLRAVEDAARRLGAGDSDGPRAGAGRRRSRGGRDGLQRDGRRSRSARGRARRLGSRPAPTARRRLARADHADHGDARLSSKR